MRPVSKMLASTISLAISILAIGASMADPAPIVSVPNALGGIWWLCVAVYILGLVWLLTTESPMIPLAALTGLTVTILLIPIFLGFEFNGFSVDAPRHFGFIKDIAAKGAISPEYIYPGGYLITVVLSGVAEISLEGAAPLVQIAFFGVFVASAVFLSRFDVAIDERLTLSIPFTWVVIMVVMTGTFTFFFPFSQSVAISLLCFGLIFAALTTNDLRIRGLALLALSVTVIIHPLLTASLLLFLAAVVVLNSGVMPDSGRLPYIEVAVDRSIRELSIWIAALAGLISFSWVLYATSGYFSGTARRAILLFTHDSYFQEVHRLAAQASLNQPGVRSNFGFVEYLGWYYGYRYGPALAIIGLGGLASLYTLWNSARDRLEQQFDTLLFVGIATLGGFAAINGVASVLNVGPVRLVVFPLLLCALAIARAVARNPKWRTIAVIIFVVVGGVGITKVYPAPQTTHPPFQLSEQDVESQSWLFEHMNGDQALQDDILQYHYYLYGYESTENAEYLAATKSYWNPSVADLLRDYGPNSPLGVEEDSYIGFSATDHYKFTRYYPNLPHSDGYAYLDSDTSVNKIYTNGLGSQYRIEVNQSRTQPATPN